MKQSFLAAADVGRDRTYFEQKRVVFDARPQKINVTSIDRVGRRRDFDEHAFEGTGIFILGSILERFFAKYVSLNSFTETVIRSQQRGDIITWPAHPGRRPII